MSSQTTSASLNMFGYYKHQGSIIFNQHAKEHKERFTHRMKATLANIVEPQNLGGLIHSLYPSIHTHTKKLSDEDTLDRLNILYRDEPHLISTIERAYDASSGIHGKKIFPDTRPQPIPEETEEEVEEADE